MTSQLEDDRLGKLLYDAYRQTGSVSLDNGERLLPWERLESRYRTAWIGAARTLEIAIRQQVEVTTDD